MRRRGWKLTETKDMPGLGFVRMMPHKTHDSDYPFRTELELRRRRTHQLIKSFKGSHGYYGYFNMDGEESE